MNTYDSQYMLLKEKNLKQIINKEKTVVVVAKEMAVSRHSVHKWLSRYKRFGIDGLITRKRIGCKKAHNRTTAEVEQLVIQISKKYWNDGVETLHDHLLHENNIELNPSTIYRIRIEWARYLFVFLSLKGAPPPQQNIRRPKH